MRVPALDFYTFPKHAKSRTQINCLMETVGRRDMLALLSDAKRTRYQSMTGMQFFAKESLTHADIGTKQPIPKQSVVNVASGTCHLARASRTLKHTGG